MGNKNLDAEKMLRVLSYSIHNNQDMQSRGTKVNPRQANPKYFNPAIFPALSHVIVWKLGMDTPPQVRHVVYLRNCANRVPCRKGLRRESPPPRWGLWWAARPRRQIYASSLSKGWPGRIIVSKRDAPLRPSQPNQGHPLQAGDEVHPRFKLRHEGAYPQTRALIHGYCRPILVN